MSFFIVNLSRAPNSTIYADWMRARRLIILSLNVCCHSHTSRNELMPFFTLRLLLHYRVMSLGYICGKSSSPGKPWMNVGKEDLAESVPAKKGSAARDPGRSETRWHEADTTILIISLLYVSFRQPARYSSVSRTADYNRRKKKFRHRTYFAQKTSVILTTSVSRCL